MGIDLNLDKILPGGNNFKILLVTFFITGVFWYLNIYFFNYHIIYKNPVYIPVLLSFAISYLWYYFTLVWTTTMFAGETINRSLSVISAASPVTSAIMVIVEFKMKWNLTNLLFKSAYIALGWLIFSYAIREIVKAGDRKEKPTKGAKQ